MKKILIVMISILFLTGCGSKSTISNSKLNNNENIIKDQTINNFSITDISLNYKKGTSTLKLTITNTLDQDVNINKFEVVFKTENGSVITTLDGKVIDSMKANESITLTLNTDVNLSEAYSVEYVID